MAGIRDLWPSYVSLAKEAYLYDSNDTDYKVIAEGKGLDFKIFDEETYENFMQKKEKILF